MKIAYVISDSTFISGNSNGVRMQAETWATQLERLGHEVARASPWGAYDWPSFDIIHIFGFGPWIEPFIEHFATRTKAKVVNSPVTDPFRSRLMQRLASYCGFGPLHMTSPMYSIRKMRQYFCRYYVRSRFEESYLVKSFDIPAERIELIPLSFRMQTEGFSAAREDFCLHVSILSGPHKNVRRLVEAAIRYDFRLVLAGSYGTETFRTELERLISGHPNIEALGFVSEDKLKDLFSRAKVFALPSIYEGVGLVALEAAACGCDVVITNQGGPKEYYGGLAWLVNPKDTDEIGRAIGGALSGKTFQPRLREHIIRKYNVQELTNALANSYRSLSRQ